MNEQNEKVHIHIHNNICHFSYKFIELNEDSMRNTHSKQRNPTDQ